MKTYSSINLNAAIIFMLHFAFAHSERLLATGRCISWGGAERCKIPAVPPGTEFKINLITARSHSCGRGKFWLHKDGQSIVVSGGCNAFYEVREKVPEESGHPLTCGRRGGSDGGFRIIGGAESRECELPWMVFVHGQESDLSYTCGGSILNRFHILTAAHCVANDDGSPKLPDFFTIFSGTSYMDVDSGRATKSYASKIYSHENWRNTSYEDDIAIIKLKQPLDWDKCHSPICLPDGKIAPGNGGNCITAGWGRTSPGGEGTKSLMWTDIDIKSCNVTVLGKSLCSKGNNRGICSGDSGGPLACRRSDSEGYTQFGINSAVLGEPCREASQYMDVTKYLSWINGVLGK